MAKLLFDVRDLPRGVVVLVHEWLTLLRVRKWYRCNGPLVVYVYGKCKGKRIKERERGEMSSCRCDGDGVI